MEDQSGHPQYGMADQGFRPFSSLLLQAPSTAQQHLSSSANAASIQMPLLPSHTDDSNINPTDDGYNWGICGYKGVQGDWHQIIYYECTQPNCGVQKSVVRSADGHIAEIIYRGAHNHPRPSKMWLGNGSARLNTGSRDYVQLEVSDEAAGTAGPSMPRMGEGGEQSSGSSDSDEDDDGEVRVDGDAARDASAIERHVPAPAQRITAQTASEVGVLYNGCRRNENSQRSKKGRSKSKVWEEFTAVSSDGKVQSAECIHCKKCLSGKSSGGTSHLRRHLKTCPARPGTSRVQQKCSTSQPDISVAKNWKFAQENSLEGLISAIVSNICPFSVMRGASFGPAGSSPTFNMVPQPQATVEDRFLSVFQNEKSKLKEKIKVAPGGVFLSVGNWDYYFEVEAKFLFLTVHFIDEDWKVNRRIIRCTCSDIEDTYGDILWPSWRSHMNYSLDPANMVLKEAVGDWSLENKLLGLTLEKSVDLRDLEDNLTGRNYLLAKCKLLTVPCMVGTLHDLFGWEPNDFILQTSKIWSRYMTKSPERKQKYQEILSKLHLNRPSFGSKKWYITFYGLEVALQFSKSFPNAEQIPYERKPSLEELEATENFCKIARQVYHAIKVLSDPHHATLNSYFHVLWSLRAALQESSNIKNIEKVFNVTDMQSTFDKNWDKWYLWLSVAVVLDPRYKISFVESCFKQAFSHDAGMYVSELYAKLYELYIRYSYDVNEQSDDTLNHSNNSSQVGDPLHNRSQNYSTQAAAGKFKELHEYLAGELCPQNDAFDILMWWKDNASTYPTLAKMARDILAIPGCAVSAESAFDQRDERLGLFNRKLRPETIEALICAQSWRSSGTSGADGGNNGMPV